MKNCPLCDGSLELVDTLHAHWGIYACGPCDFETQEEIILADIFDDAQSE